MSGEGNPDRDSFQSNPIEHMSVSPGMTVGELVAEYGNAGGNAHNVSTAVEVFSEMVRSDDVLVVCGLAGAVVPCGMRELVSDLIRDGFIDVLVTTGATITHDSIEAIGGHHHHGSATPPAGQSRMELDESLREAEIDRIYNVYLPQEHFAAFEHHLREHVFPE
jgi:deoxyhypusine synthase